MKIGWRRGFLIAASSLLLLQFFPTIAEVLTPSPEVTISETATVTTSTDESPQPQDSDFEDEYLPESSNPAPTGEYSYSIDSESLSARSVVAQSQDLALRVPTQFRVDPRATSLKISPLAVLGEGDVLVCISTDADYLWLSNITDALQVQGNVSNELLVSGTITAVHEALNMGQGLRLVSNGKVQGSTLTTRAVQLTEPSLDENLCSKAERVVISRILPLGLDLNTVKNPVRIR